LFTGQCAEPVRGPPQACAARHEDDERRHRCS
jgi:hypothetical protein